MRTAAFPAIILRTAPLACQLAVKKTPDDGIKSDVYITRDGKLVIFHDASVERTYNGTGFIKGMTYDELPTLDIGARKSLEFTGQHIWAFGQRLDFCQETKMLLNMELKNYEVFYEGLEQRVIDEICDRKTQDQVFVSSFNHISMRHVKELCPDIETRLLYDKPCLDMELVPTPTTCTPRYMLLQYQPELMELFLGWGIKFNTWTVNDEENIPNFELQVAIRMAEICHANGIRRINIHQWLVTRRLIEMP